MPHLELPDARLYYEETGAGSETLIFSSSYLLDHSHFAPQIAALKARYRIVAYDHRGHGASAHLDHPCSMQDIVDDGIAVIERIAAGPVHWIGLSTGGFVGMRIALQRPELLRSLTLMSTSAEAERFAPRLLYRGLVLMLRHFGFRPVLGQAVGRLFGSRFRANPGNGELLRREIGIIRSQDIASVIHFGTAIWDRDDVSGRVATIAVPTLVVAGELDVALPPHHGRRMSRNIPGARFELIRDAGHICTLEAPGRVNEVLNSFLAGVAASASGTQASGG